MAIFTHRPRRTVTYRPRRDRTYRPRRDLACIAMPAVLALLPMLVTGCSLPWATAPPSGMAVLRSPGCHCRLTYPASWYSTSSNNDWSKPALGLDSYDSVSADHAPIPTRFASIGIDWQDDPIGQLYLAATTRHFSPWPARQLVVSGWQATSYAHWTAPPAQGGIYVQHVYFFVPWYQRTYDVWLQGANPPGRDISAFQRVFAGVLSSLKILPRGVIP